MLTNSDALPTFPAISVPVPSTNWSAPSVVTTLGSEQEDTPLRLSEQSKLTVTSVLFQPLAVGKGEREDETVGAVLSRRGAF